MLSVLPSGLSHSEDKGSARSFQASCLNMLQTSTHTQGLGTVHCCPGTKGRAIRPCQCGLLAASVGSTLYSQTFSSLISFTSLK